MQALWVRKVIVLPKSRRALMGCSSSLTQTLGKMAVGVEWTLLAKVLLLGPWQRTWGDGLIFRGELVGPASLHAAGQGGHMGSQGLFLGGGMSGFVTSRVASAHSRPSTSSFGVPGAFIPMAMQLASGGGSEETR